MNDDDLFATDHLLDGLDARSARSGALVVTSKAFELAVRFATLVVMARLLTPSEFGLFGMAVAPIALQVELSKLGFSTALVQSRELDHRTTNALFWVQILLSSALALLSLIAAPLVARFFGNDALAAMIAFGACGVWVSGLASIHVGLLVRQMRFRGMAAMEVVSALAAAGLGLALAIYGAGAWALLAQGLCVQLILLAFAWRLCRWRPTRPILATTRDPVLRRLVYFGRDTWAVRIAERFSFELPAVVLGRIANAAEVGLLQNAQRWAGMPAGELLLPLRSVAIGALSRVRDDDDAYRRFGRIVVLATTSLLLPLLTIFVIDAPRVIDALLGSGWEGAVLPFRLLAIAGTFDVMRAVISWFALADGRTRLLARWALWRAAAIGVGIVAGASLLSVGVAAGITAASVATALPFIVVVLRDSPIRGSDVASAGARPLAAAALAGGVLFLAPGPALIASPIPGFLVDLALFSVVYLGAWLAMPGGLAQARRIVIALRGEV